MKVIKFFALLPILLSSIQNSYATAVDVAQARSIIYLDALSSEIEEFGKYSIEEGNKAIVTNTGTDAAGTPYVSLSASRPFLGAGQFEGFASIVYYWQITGNEGSVAPILVHFSTTSVLSGADTGLFQLAVGAGFYTNIATGIDQRSIGFQSYGNGVNGSFSPTTAATAIQTVAFDLWVTPNLVENYIYMSAIAVFNPGPIPYSPGIFSIYAFVDPIITIDSQYGSKYKLEVSDMPFFPTSVPELKPLELLLIAGLFLFAARSHKFNFLRRITTYCF